MQLKKALPGKFPAVNNTNESESDSSNFFSATRGYPPQTSKSLPAEGFVRLKQILAPNGPIPCSPATWWEGVRTGRFPRPTKFFGPGITAWNVQAIRDLIDRAALTNETEKFSNTGGAK